MSSPSAHDGIDVFRFAIEYEAKDARAAEQAYSAAIGALTEGTHDGFAGHVPDWPEYERNGWLYWIDIDFSADDLKRARELSKKAAEAINQYGNPHDEYRLSPAETGE